jgi:hypothetical protein
MATKSVMTIETDPTPGISARPCPNPVGRPPEVHTRRTWFSTELGATSVTGGAVVVEEGAEMVELVTTGRSDKSIAPPPTVTPVRPPNSR